MPADSPPPTAARARPCVLVALLAAACALSYLAGRHSPARPAEPAYPALLIACDADQARDEDWTLASTPRGHRGAFVYKTAAQRDRAYAAALDALMSGSPRTP